jgi:hypothetical protein
MVVTVAGTLGTPCADPTSACGDGGPATAATLTSPWAVALDDESPPNIWVSDYGAHKLRRIDAGTGTITTVAGTGLPGYDGDGTATASRLNYPSGLTVDGAGDVLVADRGNDRIRRISPGGTMTNFLASGSPGWSGDFCTSVAPPFCDFDGPSDIEVKRDQSVPPVRSTTEFFIAERGDGSLWSAYAGPGGSTLAQRIGLGSTGFADGPSITAAFHTPVDLDYDPQRLRLYVADGFFQRVRRFDLLSGNVETVAGDGTGKGYSSESYVEPTNGGVDPLGTAVNFPIGVAHRPTSSGTAPAELYLSAVWENQLRSIAFVPQMPCVFSTDWQVMGC